MFETELADILNKDSIIDFTINIFHVSYIILYSEQTIYLLIDAGFQD